MKHQSDKNVPHGLSMLTEIKKGYYIAEDGYTYHAPFKGVSVMFRTLPPEQKTWQRFKSCHDAATIQLTEAQFETENYEEMGVFVCDRYRVTPILSMNPCHTQSEEYMGTLAQWIERFGELMPQQCILLVNSCTPQQQCELNALLGKTRANQDGQGGIWVEKLWWDVIYL